MSKVNLSHDTIAKVIYEKASAEERQRLKIERFVKQRYEQYNETEALLSESELHYIEAFLDQIDISKEQKIFIDKSERVNRIRDFRQRFGSFAIGITIVLIALVVWGFYELYRAEEEAGKVRELLQEKSLILQKREEVEDSLRNQILINDMATAQIKKQAEVGQRLVEALQDRGVDITKLQGPAQPAKLSDKSAKALLQAAQESLAERDYALAFRRAQQLWNAEQEIVEVELLINRILEDINPDKLGLSMEEKMQYLDGQLRDYGL